MSCDKEHFAPSRRAICIYAAFISGVLVDMTGADHIKQIGGKLNFTKAQSKGELREVLCRKSCLDIKDSCVLIIALLASILSRADLSHSVCKVKHELFDKIMRFIYSKVTYVSFSHVINKMVTLINASIIFIILICNDVNGLFYINVSEY